jgi:hypothetical protein
MFTIPGKTGRCCDGISRRAFMQIGGLGFGGLTLPQLLRAEKQAGVSKSHKSVIMVLLPGGPSHLDMFDLKPDAPTDIRGEFLPISTNVPGIEICELMPRLAKMADKLVPIRSLVGAPDDHNVHWCVTGWESHPEQTGSKERPGYPPGGWPSMGAVVSRMQGSAVPGVPPNVDLSPDYYDARFVKSAGLGQAGFLGPAHTAMEVATVDREHFRMEQASLDRLDDRKALLREFDRFRRTLDSRGVMQQMDAFSEQAFQVLSSGRLAHALDLSKEDPAVRARYGVQTSETPVRGGGKHLDQFLLARRVIEAGARCVSLAFSRYPFGRMLKGDYNWDWHKDNFAEARGTLPLLDLGLSTLIQDLDERGMLDDVSIVVWGEFGRTPKINANAGRDHWSKVAGALLAGGGMKTGQVIGATNRFGEHAQKRPVHFREVFATLYHQLGLNLQNVLFKDLAGRPLHVLDNHRPLPELI